MVKSKKQVENELARLKHENRYLKRTNRNLEDKLFTEESFFEKMSDANVAIKSPKSFKRPILPEEIKYTPQDLVILFSDCQIGEKVEFNETQLGEYNIEIFKDRVNNYYETIMRIVDRYRMTTPINKAHIFMLGDIVEGEQIYKGQGARITDDLVTQFFEGKGIISRFISDVSANFDNLNIECIAGNHGRFFKKDEVKFYDNFDYMMYRYMEDTLKEHKNINWNIPMSWWTISKVQNSKFYLTHGDDLFRYMGVPWYSMERSDGKTTKMLKMVGEEYDHMIMGHHHQAIMWDGGPGERIVNGSFSSANYYAAKKLNLMTYPKQIIFGVHPEIGITFRYIIDLTKKGGK